MIRFTTGVRVERPPEAVFAYISDPAKLSEWQGTAEVEQITPGPVQAGTRFREVHAVLGRRTEQVTEVAEFDPPRIFAVRVVEGPVRLDGHWELTAADGGTLVTRATTARARARPRCSRSRTTRASGRPRASCPSGG